MAESYRIAGVQMDIAFADVGANLRAIKTALTSATAAGAFLTVFPECALTGYCFESLAEAIPFAETVPGPSTLALAEACREANAYAIVGLLEREEDRVYNAAAIVGPRGVVGCYRKIHLPFLGVDRFVTRGERPFQVYDLDGMRVGVAICYDCSFPETTRVMALDGADLVALPTNWPPPAISTSEFVVPTRAQENHIYFLAVNRIGEERGFSFVGRSKFCDPLGGVISASVDASPQVLWGEVRVAWPRNKHLVRVPGLHEIDRFADRRPEMYTSLSRPNA